MGIKISLFFLLVPVFVSSFNGSTQFLVLFLISLFSIFYLKFYFLFFLSCVVLLGICSPSWLCWTFTHRVFKLVENGLISSVPAKMWLNSTCIKWILFTALYIWTLHDMTFWFCFPATSDRAFTKSASQHHLMWAKMKFLVQKKEYQFHAAWMRMLLSHLNNTSY